MIFHGFTRVGCPDLQCPNIHVLRLDAGLFRRFAEDKRSVLAHSARARRAKNDGNKKRAELCRRLGHSSESLVASGFVDSPPGLLTQKDRVRIRHSCRRIGV